MNPTREIHANGAAVQTESAPWKQCLPVVLTVLALAHAWSGCQQDLILDVDLADPDPELVVNSLFRPDSLFDIYVGSSVPLLGGATPHGVEGATVEIIEDGQVIDVGVAVPVGSSLFLPEGVGLRYRTTSAKASIGKTYEVRASADSFEQVRGTSSVPEPVAISTATFTDSVGTNELGPVGEVRFTFDDPGGRVNYYNVRVHHRGIYLPTGQLSTLSYGFTVISDLQDDLFGADPNDFLGSGDVFKSKEDGVTFTDAFFDGRTKEVVLQVAGGPVCGTFGGDSDFTCQIVLELSSVSEEFYLYHRTLQFQNEASQNPFAESVRIQSNMSNGLGVFAGYSDAVWIFERSTESGQR